MRELLKTEHLSVSFFTKAGEVEAVQDVSLTVEEGEVLAIVGESGCGKSALCKSIMKLLPKTAKIKSGKILADGIDITDYAERNMSRLRGALFSMIFQDPMTSLNPTMTIGKQIGEAVRIHNKKMPKKQVKEKVLELMQLVEIDEPEVRISQYPHEFSGGMRQRVALIRTLSVNPDILLLDEPFSALDNHLKSNMENELIQILKDYQGSIVYVTHDIGECYRICDDIVVFSKGLGLNKREKSELFKHPMSMTEATITGCKNISSIDIIDKNKVFAKDWGIECDLSRKIIDGAKYVGIRAHHIRIIENDLQFSRENIFKLSVVKVFESSFTYIVYVQNLKDTNSDPIQLEVDKNISPLKVGDEIFVKFDGNCLFDFC